MEKVLFFQRGDIMQNIPISLAVPGMVLARDVRADDNPASPPICGKGVSLTEGLISRLTQMGVQSLTVEGHPVRLEGEASREEMLAALDRRFVKVQDDPLMMTLKEICRRNLIRSMGQDDGR
jgi:hypothetical protein